jgi:ubiquinone biosynthesis protein COQ9
MDAETTPEPPAEPRDWADEAEQRLLAAAIPLAPKLGWNARLLARAGEAAGLSAGETSLVLPNGARDLAALFARRHDQAMMQALAEVDPKALKIRERIRVAVEARLAAATADREATRRCAGFLTLPANAPLGLRLAWESADVIWRWAGDTATDENHYSKRAILAGILITTLAVRLSAGREAASVELAARIDNVMAFEKWKATRKPSTLGQDLAGWLGRLRYGSEDVSPTHAAD